MAGNRGRYVLSILAIGIAAAFSYAVPLVVRFVIDFVIGTGEASGPSTFMTAETAARVTTLLDERLWIAGVVILVLTLAAGVFSFLAGRGSAVASERTTERMRNALYDHLQRVPFSYHVRAATGDLIQRCTSDVETVRKFMALQFVEIGRALFMTALALPLMISLHGGLTIAAVALIPAIFIFSFAFFRRVQKAFTLSDAAEGKMSSVLQESLTGVRVVRAFGRQAHEVGKFDRENMRFQRLTYRLILLLARYWSISDLMSTVQMGILLVTGSLLAIQGNVSIGVLVVFVTVEGMLLWPIRQMGRILTDMGKATVSMGRIGEILNAPLETGFGGTRVRPEIQGGLVFRNVGFAYYEGEPVLSGITFSVKPGQTVGILGSTGSGKSTLVQLIPRLYDYSEGSITLDGTELKEIDKEWLRKHIGIVLQEPFLYAKTLRENIGITGTADRHGAADAAIFEAARTAAVHEVIQGFDRGYETPVGERGVTLSGGQKQRVAIARALVQERPILILDDALSAVDMETDAAIRRGLRRREHRATTFIVAHRISSVSHADLILVLQHGRVVQAGRHEELLRMPGMYRRIAELQQAGIDHAADRVAEGARYDSAYGARVLP
jgi:ATP-binding cassette subfamily B protein